MAIFDEKVLEQFMPRGMGNSGVASREIQATNLPNLSAAVRESEMALQNLQNQRLSTTKGLSIKNSIGVGMGGNEKSEIDVPQGAFAIGRFGNGGDSGTTVAIPDGKGGYTLQSLYDKSSFGDTPSNLKTIGIDPNQKLPNLGIVGLGGKYSGEDLASQLLQYGKDNNGIDISKILKKIQFGGTTQHTNAGWNAFKIAPNLSDKRLSSEKKADVFWNSKISALNEIASKAESRLNNANSTPSISTLVEKPAINSASGKVPSTGFDIGSFISKKLLGRK